MPKLVAEEGEKPPLYNTAKIMTDSLYPVAEFTIADGIAVQRTQLKRWKKVLSPKIYRELEMALDVANELRNYKSGYDVVRGTDIDQVLMNFMYNDSPISFINNF